ncbi:uncharacterized protein LOC115755327 [Rhodamnia argentea]|uniref:Uncharacterized protein LOC115755327 n=1 Tax=Rhodamnia argentea TaxID=178133 RepID=A0A8B8QW39_9MYRT|nr:uncharacterized protein LOC115755327 [Rhodamnia argentea]
MAEKNGNLVGSETPKDQKNPFSFFPNLGFKFPFQFPKKEPKPVKKPELAAGESEGESRSEKPDVVSFPPKPLESPPPLKLEVEEESGKTSNPVILWQVYAIGGFLILRWVWGRWQERKARKGSDDQATEDAQDSAPDDSTPH